MNLFELVIQNWRLFAFGTLNTLLLLGISFAIAFALSIPLGVAAAYRSPIAGRVADIYIYFFRGTPLLVQVYLLYYGLAQFGVVRASPLWPYLREAWYCLLISFILCTGAYLTQILKGGILATPRGELEAAVASGMSRLQLLRFVVLPVAFRRSLPEYSNELIFSLHGTALASTVTVIDALGAGRILNAKFYLAFEGFVIAAVIYCVIVLVITGASRLLERRYLCHLPAARR